MEECKVILSGMGPLLLTLDLLIALETQFLTVDMLFFPNLQEICNRWMMRKRDCGRQ